MSTRLIQVRIWDTLVGAVALDPGLGYYAFEYDAAWRRRGIELAPRTMPTAAPDPIWVFPHLGESFKRLPGLLSDALPDDFGNALIDAWMAGKGVRKEEITALDRLAYMGKRGLGALEFRPAQGAHRESVRPLEMKSLVEAARKVLHGDFAGDIHAQAALANMIKVGTSAGGARAKAVIAWHPRTDEIRSGQFGTAEGFEHWLLKFDGVGRDWELGTTADYGRIEYAYYLMATRHAGIVMSPCRLLHEHGRAHFMTKRFDREGNTKHHIQSLCALSHLDYKQRATHAYEQYFIAIKELGLGDEGLEQGFRRMAFNVMARNCDDHTKNFGFRLRQGGRWELAPAYDVTHAHNPKGEWTSQHLMSVNGKFDAITRDDLLTVADRFSIPRAAAALNTVKAALAGWRDVAKEAGIPEAKAAQVQQDFRPV
ncbi:MAG: type II toxin-antitoxin system HipA family toxin [Verrucomicrobia bacterium]|nr:type II toxin-antitoxin system HipA family toxin [Verrucomicrobiota bacterium]